MYTLVSQTRHVAILITNSLHKTKCKPVLDVFMETDKTLSAHHTFQRRTSHTINAWSAFISTDDLILSS